jgi:nitroreductase
MLVDLLRERRSCRNFTGEEVKKTVIDNILEAGRLSPSGGNEQPWKFGVITDKNLIQKIARIAYNQSWIATASFLVVLCTGYVPDERGGRDIQKSRYPELSEVITQMDIGIYTKLNQEEHQTKIPGTHMITAGLEQGLSATWISLFKVDEVALLLNLPENFIPGEIIAFGYPSKKEKPLKKKSLEEIVFYNSFE